MQNLFTCCFSFVKLYRQSKLVTTKENNEKQSNQMTISNLSLIHFEAFDARLFLFHLLNSKHSNIKNVKIVENIEYDSRRTNDVKFP